MAKKQKLETVSIGQYLLAKDGKTRYIKLGASPKADQKTQDLVKRVIQALGTDRLFVNIFDDDFREQYKIAEFVKGRINVPVGGDEQGSSNDEVDF